QMTLLGAKSSSVRKVEARSPILRVQLLMTPDPTLILFVTAAYPAIGTIASRTNLDSACQTASKPFSSAYLAYSNPSRKSCESCKYRATRSLVMGFSLFILDADF